MRLIRYRRRSLKTILGITRTKKRINRAIGLTAMLKPARAIPNFKRRIKRKAGYYSEPMKFFRWFSRMNKKR